MSRDYLVTSSDFDILLGHLRSFFEANASRQGPSAPSSTSSISRTICDDGSNTSVDDTSAIYQAYLKEDSSECGDAHPPAQYCSLGTDTSHVQNKKAVDEGLLNQPISWEVTPNEALQTSPNWQTGGQTRTAAQPDLLEVKTEAKNQEVSRCLLMPEEAQLIASTDEPTAAAWLTTTRQTGLITDFDYLIANIRFPTSDPSLTQDTSVGIMDTSPSNGVLNGSPHNPARQTGTLCRRTNGPNIGLQSYIPVSDTEHVKELPRSGPLASSRWAPPKTTGRDCVSSLTTLESLSASKWARTNTRDSQAAEARKNRMTLSELMRQGGMKLVAEGKVGDEQNGDKYTSPDRDTNSAIGSKKTVYRYSREFLMQFKYHTASPCGMDEIGTLFQEGLAKTVTPRIRDQRSGTISNASINDRQDASFKCVSEAASATVQQGVTQMVPQQSRELRFDIPVSSGALSRNRPDASFSWSSNMASDASPRCIRTYHCTGTASGGLRGSVFSFKREPVGPPPDLPGVGARAPSANFGFFRSRAIL